MELLAPAGSKQALIAAVQSGADAVYMGGTKFSARHSAKNFTAEEMTEWIEYCHLRGVSVHVAANTLIKERETEEFLEYMGFLNSVGADAVIIQDIGMAAEAKKRYPDLTLHASTQMTAASLDAVLALEAAGFDRVVLARELSRKSIERIANGCRAELEVFVHGALCMCYSGQCLMSSMIGGRSGNRGRCAQPCRLPYTLLKNGSAVLSGTLLSPKDLMLVRELSALEEIGVASLKIEGRLKRAEYVSAVTGVYRRCIDNAGAVSAEDISELEKAFNRGGFTDGYFNSAKGRAMMSYEVSGNNEENSFTPDAVKRCGETTNLRRVGVDIYAEIRKGKPASVTLADNLGNTFTAVGGIAAEEAVSVPLTRERLESQLKKLGSTVYTAQNIEITADEGISLPISEINDVRRKAAEGLSKLRIAVKPGRALAVRTEHKSVTSKAPELTASVTTLQQLKAVAELGIKRIHIPSGLYQRAAELVKDSEIVTRLPYIYNDERDLPNIYTDAVSVSHLGQLKKCKGKKLYGNIGLNICNTYSLSEYAGMEAVTLSPELSFDEIRAVKKTVPTEVIVYGRLPLMHMECCPIRSATGKCGGGKDTFELKDRKNIKFPIVCEENCVAVLLNSKPIFTADLTEELLGLGAAFLRLDFTIETYEEAKKICETYLNAVAFGKGAAAPEENSFTRGHFRNGVK